MAIGTTRPETTEHLDPVTFEVLKNAFVNIVDQMAEQIFRTCYSFVIYSRDFSSALCDPDGNTVMQGSGDIAAHVGTLHFTAKAVINAFGDDIQPGDVFVVNDPFLGGTHFNDTRIVRGIFYKGELLGFSQANGHWADVGGAVPGSFNVKRRRPHGRGPAHHAGAGLGRRRVPRGRGDADRQQHPRAAGHHRRHAGAGRGHARSPSARSSASATSTAWTSSRPRSPRCRTTSRR